MFGTSWGGTASLQANIDAPQALKACVAVCATHNRYEDDIHHMGGCLIPDSVEWGATLPTILSAPPTRNLGHIWRDVWQDRLNNLAFPLEHWVREEARGTYWRHGSVTHNADKLTRPVLCVGGWADRYSNSVMSLLDKRPDLIWGVVGPWGHHYPDQGHPAPGIGFQELMLGWWQHWLNPEKAKTDLDWPRLRAWMREFDTPQDAIDHRNGHWVETSKTVYHLGPGCFCDDPVDLQLSVPGDLPVGRNGADTGYFGRFGGLPLDQADEDAKSLCFDGVALDQDRLIYGAVEVDLTVSATDMNRQLVFRLNDVAPDGTSSRVIWVVRNLALDDHLDEPTAPLPHDKRRIRVTFPTMAYRFRKGHKIRLAVSSSYWPMVWTPKALDGVVIDQGWLELPEPNAPLPEPAQPLPLPGNWPVNKKFHATEHSPVHRFQTELPDGVVHSGWHQPYTAVRLHETDTGFGYETRVETAETRQMLDHPKENYTNLFPSDSLSEPSQRSRASLTSLLTIGSLRCL